MDWIVDTIYYVVPFLVLLGILVFVHEFGHFIVARLTGVQVAEFSIGFGKTLWSRTDKKGTEWKLSLVPLGGYCKFLGDDDASSSCSSEAKNDIKDEELGKAFFAQGPLKKLAIVIAGPAANYLFAILLFAGLFYSYGKISLPPVVGEVMPESAAEAAGIMSGDRITRINGSKIDSFADITRQIALHVDSEDVSIEILRNDEPIALSFPLKPIILESDSGVVEEKAVLGIKSVTSVEVDKVDLSIGQAIAAAGEEAWKLTTSTLQGIGQIVTGKRSSKDVGGIIRIAEMSGDVSKSGIVEFIIFTAILSINLGMINLFPIPVLDGGHVVIYTIELITRREVNDKIKDSLFKLGFAFIIFLMVFATWNDIVHLFDRWFA